MKALDQLRKLLKIIGSARNETIHTVPNQIGHSGFQRSYNRKAASHRFRHGQAERVFAAGTDVQIGSSVEIENIFPRWFKTTALCYAERIYEFPERVRGIISGRNHQNGKFSQSAHSAKNGFEPLCPPIVTDQKKDEI